MIILPTTVETPNLRNLSFVSLDISAHRTGFGLYFSDQISLIKMFWFSLREGSLGTFNH